MMKDGGMILLFGTILSARVISNYFIAFKAIIPIYCQLSVTDKNMLADMWLQDYSAIG